MNLNEESKFMSIRITTSFNSHPEVCLTINRHFQEQIQSNINKKIHTHTAKKMTLMSYLVQNQRMRCFHSFQLRVTKLSCFSAPVEVNQFLWTVLRTSAAAAAKSLQSCKTLCDPIDGSPPGSPVPGILQARTLEWVAISFSNAWKWKVKVKSFNHVWLFTTPWTAAYQALPSMGLFS